MLYSLSKILTPINRPSAFAVFLCENGYVLRQGCERPHWGFPSPRGLCAGHCGATASGPALLTPAGGTALHPGSPAAPVLLWGEKLKDEWGGGW